MVRRTYLTAVLLAFLLLFIPAFDLGLTRAAKPERSCRDIFRDDRAGTDKGIAPHRNRRNEHDIASHERAIAHGGGPLLLAVVVARDRACSDVDVFTKRRIPDVGKMRNLRPLPDRGLLDLDVRARLRTNAHMRFGAQIGTRTARNIIIDARFKRDRLFERAAIPHNRIDQARMRADDATASHAC